jgi:hypothetical protein
MIERMGILSACHIPGVRADALRPDLSPVNTLRLLFNARYGADLPLLPDRALFSSYARPYDFREVAVGEYAASSSGRPQPADSLP